MNVQDSRPEIELLIACARPSVEAGCVRELAEGGLDWDDLIDRSVFHSTLPLLRRTLADCCPDALPLRASERLENLDRKNTARTAFLTARLFSILDLLKTEGIRALPYKGPVLARACYGDPSMRRYDDLDFLVDRGVIPRIKALFVAQGYRPHLELSPAEEEAYLKAGWEMILLHGDDPYSVEFDSGVAPRYFGFELPFDELWNSRATVDLDGRRVETLSPDHLLLILCAHGAKHLWERLIWISDIARLCCGKHGIDAKRITRRARELGGSRMLAIGLLLARNVMGATLPEEMANHIARDAKAGALADQAMLRLMKGASGGPSQRTEKMFHLRARERCIDRVRYCTRLLITPSYGDWQWVKLPGPLLPLHRALRPLRLALKGARTVLRSGARRAKRRITNSTS